MADEGNALGRVNPGDALNFPAQTFNIFCDTAEEVARMKRRQFADRQPGRGINTGIVTVRNDSGGDLDRFAVLGIGAPIIDNSDNLAEFQNRVTFKGQLPDIDLHRGRFVILLEPLADGAIGKAVVSGVCQVLVNVSDAAHTFADVIDGDATTLASAARGVPMLWKETGTGDDKCAIVRLGQLVDGPARFELKDALTPGGNATAYLRTWSGSAWVTDTAVEFEVYDVLGKFRGRARTAYADPHDDGSFGEARYNTESGHWEIESLTPHALMISGLTVAEVLATDAHFHITVASTAVMQPTGGIICDQDPAVSGGMQIDNANLDWALDSGAYVIAVWDEANDKWQALQGHCPA